MRTLPDIPCSTEPRRPYPELVDGCNHTLAKVRVRHRTDGLIDADGRVVEMGPDDVLKKRIGLAVADASNLFNENFRRNDLGSGRAFAASSTTTSRSAAFSIPLLLCNKTIGVIAEELTPKTSVA